MITAQIFRQMPHKVGASVMTIMIVAAMTGTPLQAATTKTLSDRTITDAVEDEFLFDPAVAASRLDVSTRQGVVTLNGVTSNILEKERATRLARTVKGVESVVNNIKVRPSTAKTGEALRNDVRAALTRNAATDSFEIMVAASDKGEVTLNGAVESWAERELAATVAKNVVGVTAVDNNLDLKYENQTLRRDHEVKAEVEQLLYWDVLVDSGLIDVAVVDRMVKLTGTVGSAAERSRAVYTAYVNGVSQVDATNLEIQDWARLPHRRAPNYTAKPDEDVADAVKKAILYDPRVEVTGIDVKVSGTTATLRGEVGTLAAKRAAEQDARNTVHIYDVVNRLQIRPEESNSDADIAKRIEEALSQDPYVEPFEVSIVVNGGVAKLYGVVDTYYEKSRAEHVAESIKGVVGLSNNLTVRNDHVALPYDPYLTTYPPYLYGWYDYEPLLSYRADWEIHRDIKDELWWSPFVDANEVKVSVADGTATLTGQVDSMAEWHAASENAWEGGASWVINKLEVD